MTGGKIIVVRWTDDGNIKQIIITFMAMEWGIFLCHRQ